MEKKICVYAISKNEIKFVQRWFDSVKEADYVCVLDTGSDDGTYEKLKELGVIAKQKKYKTFRFDKARNDSIKLIPDDAEICISVDIDEVFEKGWSKLVKENWKDNTTRARYRYTWNYNSDGSEGVVFMADKMHKNKMYKWVNPVHEVLAVCNGEEEVVIDLPQVRLYHKTDNSKSRASYLPLLELSVKEDPTNDRNMHYLGREYMFYGHYQEAIDTLKKHLALPSATWSDERAASYRFIGYCLKKLGNTQEAEENYLKAVLEAGYVREGFYDLAEFYFESEDYLKSAVCFEQMLKIDSRYLNYMSAPKCWGSLPYDYLSICYYKLEDYQKAIENVDKAIELNQNEIRLQNNKKYFKLLLSEIDAK